METPENLFPKQNENRANFMGRCMTNSQMQNAYDKDQRADVCALIFDENASPAQRGNDVAEMDLFGVVGVDFSASDVSEFLKAAGKDQPVRINVFSGGGKMFEGAAIYAMLKRHDGKVTVDILGLAASAASYLAMAGDTVRIDAGGQFMLHNAIGEVRGNPNQLRESADDIEKQQRGMITAYAQKTGMSEDEIKALMDAETWMNADEAKRAGFVDAIFEMDEDKAVAAALPEYLAKDLGLSNIPDDIKLTAETPQLSTKQKPKHKTHSNMENLQAIAATLIAFNPQFNGGETDGATEELVAAEVKTLVSKVERLSTDLAAEKLARKNAAEKLEAAEDAVEAMRETALQARVSVELGAIAEQAGVTLAADAKDALTRRVKRYIEIDAEGDEADLRADLREDAIAYAEKNGVETGESATIPKGKKKHAKKVHAQSPTMSPEVGTEDVAEYEAQLQAKVEAHVANGKQFGEALTLAKNELSAEQADQ